MSSKDNKNNRESIIIKTSIVAILINLILVAFKATVGIFSSSIAIILDALNNLSDALSSIITIVGAKLASKEPDKEHPLGHGRIEYLSAITVASIILYTGISSLIGSVKKIFNPSLPKYSNTVLFILVISIIIKIFLGKYVVKNGKKANSQTLVASGEDAKFDAILSFSVLATAILYINMGLNLEAYVGVLISVIIIKSGVEIFLDAVNDILGRRIDRETISAIKKAICSMEEVKGAYDLTLHSYGPNKYIGSVHIEISDTMTAEEIDPLERRITDEIYKKHGVLLTGISVYSVNTKDEKIIKIRSKILETVMNHKEVLEFHGFYLDEKINLIRFDIILDYSVKNRKEIYKIILDEVKKLYPEYEIYIKVDIDI